MCPLQPSAGLCSWLARRQAWSSSEAQGPGLGTVWGPPAVARPWLPGAGAGCRLCWPGEGPPVVPGRQEASGGHLPWMLASLEVCPQAEWASASQTSEPAAPLAHPACPAPPLSPPQRQHGQPSRARARLLTPVTGPQWLQLQAFTFVGRGVAVPRSGAVPPKASLGPWVEPCSPLSP